MPDDQPSFGEANNAPPSFYSRIPSGAVMDLEITDKEMRVFAVLCSYANNQGFAYPNQKTLWKKAGCHVDTVRKAIKKLKKKKYIQVVSKYRSHPKWRHVMGNVYRVVYDQRLTQDDLVDAMDREDPPAIEEKDIPEQPVKGEVAVSNQSSEERARDVKVIKEVAKWWAMRCGERLGQFKIIDLRANEQAEAVLKVMTVDQVKEKGEQYLTECRQLRRPAPDHLGFMLRDLPVSLD